MRPPRRDGALKMGSVLFRSHGERLSWSKRYLLDDTSGTCQARRYYIGLVERHGTPSLTGGSFRVRVFEYEKKAFGSALKHKQQSCKVARLLNITDRQHNCNPKAFCLADHQQALFAKK